MRRIRVSVTAGAMLLSAASLARAADPPRKAYEHDLACAADMAAFQAGLQSPVDAAKRADMDKMAIKMRQDAVAAGARASVPAERVSAQIDEGRDRLLGQLRQRDAAKAKQARSAVGLTMLECSFDELGKAIAARKKASAAAKQEQGAVTSPRQARSTAR